MEYGVHLHGNWDEVEAARWLEEREHRRFSPWQKLPSLNQFHFKLTLKIALPSLHSPTLPFSLSGRSVNKTRMCPRGRGSRRVIQRFFWSDITQDSYTLLPGDGEHSGELSFLQENWNFSLGQTGTLKSQAEGDTRCKDNLTANFRESNP